MAGGVKPKSHPLPSVFSAMVSADWGREVVGLVRLPFETADMSPVKKRFEGLAHIKVTALLGESRRLGH